MKTTLLTTFMLILITGQFAMAEKKDCATCGPEMAYGQPGIGGLKESADKVVVKIEKADSREVCSSLPNLGKFLKRIKNLENKLGLPKGELFNHYQSFNCADADGIQISLIQKAIDAMVVFESTPSLAYFYQKDASQIPAEDLTALIEDDEGELVDSIHYYKEQQSKSGQ